MTNIDINRANVLNLIKYITSSLGCSHEQKDNSSMRNMF